MHIEFIEQQGWQMGAWYVENEGNAALIDPMGRLEPFLKHATERGAQLLYLLETRNGKVANASNILARENSESLAESIEIKGLPIPLPFGSFTLEPMQTPGYRSDSVCWMLKNETGNVVALFSGQSLLANELAHPDLEGINDSLEEAPGRFISP